MNNEMKVQRKVRVEIILKYVNKSLMGADRPLISKEQKMRKILPDGLQPAVWSLAVNMTELRKLRPCCSVD